MGFNGWSNIVCRFLLVLLFFVGYISTASADIQGFGCTYSSVDTTWTLIDDPNSAANGDVIGSLTVSVGPSTCTDKSPGRTGMSVQFGMSRQMNPYSTYECTTTVPGINLATYGQFGASDRCAGTTITGYPIGPLIGRFSVSSNGVGIPKPGFARTFDLIKRGAIPVGVIQVGLQTAKGVDFGYPASGQTVYGYGDLGDFNPGEIIGTTCSLATTNIEVPFGDVSGVGGVEPFSITFDSCTDQLDASAYNNAVSLVFSSERIKPDGSALRNCTASDCAKGIQIELQDGNGDPISLINPYRLSSNNPVIGPNGLTYNFNAQIDQNPDEAIEGGRIDTQLVFETIVE